MEQYQHIRKIRRVLSEYLNTVTALPVDFKGEIKVQIFTIHLMDNSFMLQIDDQIILQFLKQNLLILNLLNGKIQI